jgi:DNA-directed RNA polymerase omega subunit
MVGQSKETHMVPDGVRQKFANAGRYELIVVAARRAHDLQTGSKPLIDDWAQHKWSISVACNCIISDAITVFILRKA